MQVCLAYAGLSVNVLERFQFVGSEQLSHVSARIICNDSSRPIRTRDLEVGCEEVFVSGIFVNTDTVFIFSNK